MFEKKRHIHIDAEGWIDDLEDAQVCAVVTFPDSTRWLSNFYTAKCIESIRQDYRRTGSCLNGAYWCGSSPVIIVDKVSRERIEQVVDELIEKDEFRYLFEYFGEVEERERERYPSDFFRQEAFIDPSYVYRHANLLKLMLDRADDEVKATIRREGLGEAANREDI
jgi:hypothetical protein